MRVFRFMSMDEFKKMDAYVDMVHPKNHFNARTGSVGFCFLDSEEYDACDAIRFLSGIVSSDICVEFEVDEKYLNKSFGVYADPFLDDFFDTIDVTEYCATTYCRDVFKPVRYAFPDSSAADFVWYPYN